MAEESAKTYMSTRWIPDEAGEAATNVVEIRIGRGRMLGIATLLAVVATFGAGLFAGQQSGNSFEPAIESQPATLAGEASQSWPPQVAADRLFPVQGQPQAGPAPEPPAGKSDSLGDAPRPASAQVVGGNYSDDFGDIASDRKVTILAISPQTGR